MHINKMALDINEFYNYDSIFGSCQSMEALLNLLKIVASYSANVLITGETGSGKELAARTIHYSGSRKFKPFIPLNCTAIPEQLLESELFGHVKGSFTGALNDKKGLFEEADGGSLFLDEVGDLGLGLQAKLLRVIQDKQIRAVGGSKFKQTNVRVIAATHRDLKTMVKEGKFREDLYFRLNVIPIRIPSLKERKDDIPFLVQNIISKFATQNNSEPKQVTEEVMSILINYTWPGNIRELENVIQRAMILSKGLYIEKSLILESTIEDSTSSTMDIQDDRPTLEKLEERYIKKILDEVNNNKNKAAQLLGISRRTLYRKERIYGLSVTDTYNESTI